MFRILWASFHLSLPARNFKLSWRRHRQQASSIARVQRQRLLRDPLQHRPLPPRPEPSTCRDKLCQVPLFWSTRPVCARAGPGENHCIINIYIFPRRRPATPYVSARLPRSLRAGGGEEILARSPASSACRRRTEANRLLLCVHAHCRNLPSDRAVSSSFSMQSRYDWRVAHHGHSTLCPGESAGCMCLHLDSDPARGGDVTASSRARPPRALTSHVPQLRPPPASVTYLVTLPHPAQCRAPGPTRV